MSARESFAGGAAVARAWSTLLLKGPDRLSWLNGVVTCDVLKLAPGASAWGLCLDRKGKIQAEVFCMDNGEHCLLATPADAPELWAHLDQMLIMEDAELSVADDAYSWLEGVGPVAAYFEQLGLPWGRLMRYPEGGALLAVGPGAQEPTLAALAEFDVEHLSQERYRELRMEQGIPEFGSDFDSRDRPHEAGLDRIAISWSKGCYLGQEVVCMQDNRGKVSRRLAFFEADTTTLPSPGDAICNSAGERVGEVRAVQLRDNGQGQLLSGMVQTQANAKELRVPTVSLELSLRVPVTS